MNNVLELKDNSDKIITKDEPIKKDDFIKGFEEAMNFIADKLHKNI